MSAPCELCPPRKVEPCVRCESTLQHRHLQMATRTGLVTAQASMCLLCCRALFVRGKPLTSYLVDEERA